MTDKDTIFSTPRDQISDFKFDASVAQVFPDMIERSVPGYQHMLSFIGLLAKRFVTADSNIYDLGCAVGAVTLSIRQQISDRPCQIIAVDNSAPMVERCRLNVNNYRSSVQTQVHQADILDIPITHASMVVLHFTLQFIAPEHRQALLEKIYAGMQPGAVLVISEKYRFDDAEIDSLLIDVHHDFKRSQGYSDLEITQKRSAIENVLLPDSMEMHHQRLHAVGFKQVHNWFQCLNFGSMLAIK